MVRQNIEFVDTSSIPWKKLSKGIYEKILNGDDGTGVYTRMVKIEPGAQIDQILSHDFFEEFYVLEGAITDKTLNKTFTKGTYAFRRPGLKHGPLVSQNGCQTLEVRYRVNANSE